MKASVMTKPSDWKRPGIQKYCVFKRNLIASDREIFFWEGLNEIFKKIFDQDIEENYLDKISKIKLKSELLNNSINVSHFINKYYNTTNKKNLSPLAITKPKLNG